MLSSQSFIVQYSADRASWLVVESKPGNIWPGPGARCRNLVSVDSLVALFAQAIRITQKLVAPAVVFALYIGFSRISLNQKESQVWADFVHQKD